MKVISYIDHLGSEAALKFQISIRPSVWLSFLSVLGKRDFIYPIQDKSPRLLLKKRITTSIRSRGNAQNLYI